MLLHSGRGEAKDDPRLSAEHALSEDGGRLFAMRTIIVCQEPGSRQPAGVKIRIVGAGR